MGAASPSIPPGPLAVRDANLFDLAPLVALEQACYPPEQAYTREEYHYAIAKAKAINLIHEQEGRIVGFVGAFHHRTWRVGHIYTVNVHPDLRGQGLGRRLMDAAEARLADLGMRRCLLEVNVENESAIRLYEKCGYTLLKRIPDYYTTYRNPDAFVYEKPLSP